MRIVPQDTLAIIDKESVFFTLFYTGFHSQQLSACDVDRTSQQPLNANTNVKHNSSNYQPEVEG